ncbi:MAG: M43 family zinc metalloprotease [Cyclobacteriaceae bacterium]|nr:M43 family zinc metalloprotease [Cyclobacteriaceae bacterium]
MNRLLLVALLLFLSVWGLPNKALAQEKCGTVPYMQQLYKRHAIDPLQIEKWLEKRKQTQAIQNAKQQNGNYQIPVVVHIIHNGEPVGTGVNISDEQIISQINVLNKDFRRENTDAGNTPALFLPVAAGMGIEFILARQDPDGLLTDGIVRKKGNRTLWSFSTEEELKATSFWPSEDYLNIWVTNLSGTLLGYAQFPFSTLPGLEDEPNIAATDGVVIDYEVFGTDDEGPFFLDPQFNKGRTVTHEVGHYFGLRHIWGDDDGCTESDYVADTPNQGADTSGCPTHPASSCGGTKMFQNYMDYTDDVCMNLFTAGQVQRMQLILDDPTVPRRNTLLTSPGLSFPPGFTNDVALREIISPSPVTCLANEAVIKIQNRGIDALNSFRVTLKIDNQNATQQIINLPQPLAISDFTNVALIIPNQTIGEHQIEITVDLPNAQADNAPSNNTITKKFIVNTETTTAPIQERFDISLAQSNFTSINPFAETTWQTTTTNYKNSASIATPNANPKSEAWLVSPEINFTQATSASVRFQYSFRDNTTTEEQLFLLYSTDCGQSYTQVSIPLENSRTTTLPSTIAHWQDKLQQLPALTGEENARIAFVFKGANTNTFYIDNIQLYDNLTGIRLQPEQVFLAYPGTGNTINVSLNLPEKNPANISVYDLVGKKIASVQIPNALNQTLLLETQAITSGIYIVRVETNGQHYTQRILLNPR